MERRMNQTRRELPPLASNKRKEREETFDFLKPSTTIRSPKPGLPRPVPAAPIKTSRSVSSNPAPPPAKPILPLPPSPLGKPATPRSPPPIRTPKPAPPAPAPDKPMSDNKLLAGYLANEFLTKGTLFGQPYKPDSVPVSRMGISSDSGRTMKPPSSSAAVYSQKGKAAEQKRMEPQAVKNQRYAEVSDLLKGNNGVHIQGVVNPSQLVRMLHLQ